ncbi:MAG: VPDSG-CTERM sorting domain-containing protein, partial [Acidobacteria bacterium]|nr:VPDSG-CTERM sorting domain-containing protein [Acidobacteriota bacterium]
DMAYDGRYLYGGSIGDARIFVFDIVGPGGTTPTPDAGSTLLLMGGSLAALIGLKRKLGKS